MAFLETPRFPEDIRYDMAGGPQFSTDIVIVGSGYEQRNQNWANARGRWTLDHGPHNQTKTDTLVAFFRAVAGSAHGFRFKDWTDYEVTTITGRIGTTGYGDGTPGTMQLYKVYTQGARSESRPIRKPVTASIYRGGVLKTITTHYTLDTTTGLLTWVHDATSAASSVTVGATTQVVLTTNPGTLIAGQKLYLTGFTGADAALLNGLAHTINSVTGAGPYTFTLATNTAGKTITLGSGAGYKYPQASEALTWAGEFDVPVRFASDEMRVQHVAPNYYQWHGIEVVEIKT